MLPTLLFVGPDERVDDAIVGFIDASGLSAEVARIASGTDTITCSRRHAAESPADTDLPHALSVKLADCGDEDGDLGPR